MQIEEKQIVIKRTEHNAAQSGEAGRKIFFRGA